MNQIFFKEHHLKTARIRYRDQLKKMDRVLFPKGDASLLDESLTPDQAERAIQEALETRLGQGTTTGNLIRYLLALCPRAAQEELENLTIPELFSRIARNGDAIRGEIQRKCHSSHRVGSRTLYALLLTMSLVAMTVSLCLVALAAESVSGGAGSPPDASPALLAQSQTGEQSGGGAGFLLGGIAACAVAGAAVYLRGRGGKKPSSPPAPSRGTGSATGESEALCSQEEAMEILELAEALAEIYADGLK